MVGERDGHSAPCVLFMFLPLAKQLFFRSRGKRKGSPATSLMHEALLVGGDALLVKAANTVVRHFGRTLQLQYTAS